MNILDFIDDIDLDDIATSDSDGGDECFSDDSLDDTEHDTDSLLDSSFDENFFIASDGIDLSDDADINQPSFETEEPESTMTAHSHKYRSQIAFTGNGRCRVCNCGGWAGFGDTCENCGHFYNKHI